MLNFNLIFYPVGLILCAVAAMMVLPAAIDVAAGNNEWFAFLASACATAFIGISLCLATLAQGTVALSIRAAFVMTAIVWCAVAIAGALPFMVSDATQLSFVDALFESVSGLTTTGATVISGLDGLPRGILFWRAFLQWLGGIGIIVLAVVILPFLKVGGMQLFRAESSDTSEKIVPRSFQLVSYVAFIYVGLTAICAIAYRFAGMTAFDAACHAMSTVSTAGFSTHDASFAFFKNPAVEWIAVVFMMIGALPFTTYVRMARREPEALIENPQIRSYVLFVASVVVFMTLYLAWSEERDFAESLRLAAFNIVSVVTTTGFTNADYSLWGAGAVAVFFFLMFVGGCTGSTAGGIKMFRFQIMFVAIRTHFVHLFSPRRVYGANYDGRRVSADIMLSVLAFLSVFMLSFVVVTIALGFTGLDFITSASGAVTALSNVGPGLGPTIGPVFNMSALPDASKLILTFAMLLGRLEFFALLVLLDAAFWR